MNACVNFLLFLLIQMIRAARAYATSFLILSLVFLLSVILMSFIFLSPALPVRWLPVSVNLYRPTGDQQSLASCIQLFLPVDCYPSLTTVSKCEILCVQPAGWWGLFCFVFLWDLLSVNIARKDTLPSFSCPCVQFFFGKQEIGSLLQKQSDFCSLYLKSYFVFICFFLT